MIKLNFKQRVSLFDLPCFSSIIRCHLSASVVVGILIASIAWVGSNGEVFYHDKNYSRADINAAYQVIAEADDWRDRYTRVQARQAHSQLRTEQIRQWLPSSIDWPSTQQDIIDLAENCSLSISSIEEDTKHSGSRLAVLAANCQVAGRYSDVCQMLYQLSQQPQPIWCDSVKLIRVNLPDFEDDSPGCEATLTLRLPYAGSGTIGAKLIQAETNRAI